MKNHSASLRLAVRRALGVFVGLVFASFTMLGLRAEPQKRPGMAWIPGGELPMEAEVYHPSSRRGTDYDTGLSHLGFRCVLSPSPQDIKTTEKPNQTK